MFLWGPHGVRYRWWCGRVKLSQEMSAINYCNHLALIYCDNYTRPHHHL